MKILSIDWDYITGSCDIGKTCCGYCKERRIYQDFKRGDEFKLMPDWRNRFREIIKIKLKKKTPIYVAESHANIMNHMGENPLVLDFDFHYDNYSKKMLKCENWIYYTELRGGIVIRHPRDTPGINSVFICKSSPWTPESMDRYFYEMIKLLSINAGVEPKFIGHMGETLRKEYRHYKERILLNI